MRHYEVNPDTNVIDVFEVVEMKCTRLGGGETHWTTPQNFCQSPADAVQQAEATLHRIADKANGALRKFKDATKMAVLR